MNSKYHIYYFISCRAIHYCYCKTSSDQKDLHTLYRCHSQKSKRNNRLYRMLKWIWNIINRMKIQFEQWFLRKRFLIGMFNFWCYNYLLTVHETNIRLPRETDKGAWACLFKVSLNMNGILKKYVSTSFASLFSNWSK